MNKLFSLLSLTFILMVLTACGEPVQAASQPTASNQPTMIQDPWLQEGWNALNSLTEPVQLWDGRTISGYELAQFIVEHNVPIVWNTINVCKGNACSLQYCQGDFCTHQADDLPGIEPIYIRTSLSDPSREGGNLNELVSVLAHEIFHYTEPFGPVMVTLYEEFNAYYLGAKISGQNWTNFDDLNPLQPACLMKWFHDNHLLDSYQSRGLKAYPASVMASVDTSTTTCQPGDSQDEQTNSYNSPICSLNPDGSVNCQFPPAPTPTPEYRLECTKDANGLQGCKTIWLKDVATPQATPGVP